MAHAAQRLRMADDDGVDWDLGRTVRHCWRQSVAQLLLSLVVRLQAELHRCCRSNAGASPSDYFGDGRGCVGSWPALSASTRTLASARGAACGHVTMIVQRCKLITVWNQNKGTGAVRVSIPESTASTTTLTYAWEALWTEIHRISTASCCTRATVSQFLDA